MLSMDVLRILTVKAIKDRTWAADRVFDSPSTPADLRFAEQRASFIAVYVDSADFAFSEQGSSLMPQDGTVELIIECGVASQQKFNNEDQPIDWNDPDPDATIVTALNETDEGMEAHIAFLARQAIQALLSTHPLNPWAILWRSLISSRIENISVRRGGPGDTGEQPAPRFATRIINIKTGLLGEPVRGEDLNEFPFWQAFLEAAETDDDLRGLAELIRAHIEPATGVIPEWRRDEKYLTVTKRIMRHLGSAPIHPSDEEAALLLGDDEQTGFEQEPFPMEDESLPPEPYLTPRRRSDG